jgi:uridine kinase
MTSHKIIAVVGGTASGKTTLASDLLRIGGGERVEVIPLDAYYRCNAHLSPEDRAKVNYDHPAAFEAELLIQHLESLRAGQGIDMPTYDFATHSRSSKTKQVHPRQVTVVEGILTLCFPELRGLFSYSIFVDTPDERARAHTGVGSHSVERDRSSHA